MENTVKAWEIVTNTLKMLRLAANPGTPLTILNKMAEEYIVAKGAIPVNKGYKPHFAPTPYPDAIVICINDEIAHAIDKNRVLKQGDIVSFDVGIKKDGMCGDAALTVAVGEASYHDKKLLAVAKEALYTGIRVVKAGVRICDIGWAIDTYVKRQGFVVNRRLCGHTIGESMHMKPQILHHHSPRDMITDRLVAGQMICLEPMITKHDNYGIIQPDGWTYKTKDGHKSAFFEHQILVTNGGYEILTAHI